MIVTFHVFTAALQFVTGYFVTAEEWTRCSGEPSKLHLCPRVDCKCEELNFDQGDPLSLVCFIRPWNGEGFVIIIVTFSAIWFHAPCNCWKHWPRLTRISKDKKDTANTWWIPTDISSDLNPIVHQQTRIGPNPEWLFQTPAKCKSTVKPLFPCWIFFFC